MFVHFTDKDGCDTWINPLQVKAVRDHKGLLGGKKGSEIWLSGMYGAIMIPQPPAEIATLLNAALPSNLFTPTDDDDDQIHSQPTAPAQH
jgi:hypothetical protein